MNHPNRSHYRNAADDSEPDRYCAECFHGAHEGHRCVECQRSCNAARNQPRLFAAAIVWTLLYFGLFGTYTELCNTDRLVGCLPGVHLYSMVALWMAAVSCGHGSHASPTR